MRTELNLCEYRPFHLLSGFGQIIQYQHPKWLKPHKLDINHSLMSICRFFLCHSRYFSYSFLVSTSTQSWRSEGPQGPKARPLGTPSLVQTGKKISRNGVFCQDFTREMFDFQRCLSLFVFFYFLLQNRWLGFPQKNWKKRRFDDFLRTTSGS